MSGAGDAGGGTSADTSPRRRLSVADRRLELLSAAQQLFAARPYDDVSVDDIAGRAGASRALLYHYFGSKHDLFVESLSATSAELLRMLATEVAGATGWAAIQHKLASYLDYVDAHRVGFAALLRTGTGGQGSDVTELVDGVREVVIAQFLSRLGFAAPLPAAAVARLPAQVLAESVPHTPAGFCPPPAPPVLRLALRSYIGGAEAGCARWATERDLPRSVVLTLLEYLLAGCLRAALASTPTLGPLLSPLLDTAPGGGDG